MGSASPGWQTNRAVKIDSAVLKNLVGGSTITARPLYASLVSFKPSHLLCLMTNYKPEIPADDEAAWSRVSIITFGVRFVEYPTEPNQRQRIDRLADILKEEAPGILAWLVRGCLEFQWHGLMTPASLRAEREKYREEMDPISRFVEEQCVEGPNVEVKFSALHQAYSMWCNTVDGSRPVSGKAFGQTLKKRGYEAVQSGGRSYRGIGLQAGFDLGEEIQFGVRV